MTQQMKRGLTRKKSFNIKWAFAGIGIDDYYYLCITPPKHQTQGGYIG
jgi:hypothetical protein